MNWNPILNIINELQNNILLIASAGTEKTDSLSKRIANIIENRGTDKTTKDVILKLALT